MFFWLHAITAWKHLSLGMVNGVKELKTEASRDHDFCMTSSFPGVKDCHLQETMLKEYLQQ